MTSRKSDLDGVAKRWGFRLKRRRTHFVWEHAVTGFIAVTSSSASDKHALNQAERLFRRIAMQQDAGSS